MARKKDSPQKAALRELMENYLKENNVKVKDGTDVNSIMRDMMSIILEGALDQELDEELGYPSMIIEIKKPIIPGMDIPRKRYIPVTEIWRLIFQGIEKVTSNHRL